MKSLLRETFVLILAAMVMACATKTAGPSSVRGTWKTTLEERDLDGNFDNGPEAFYDTVLNVTWLRNANVNGRMSWTDANNWANSLVVGGYRGWRLPTVRDIGGDGCNFGHSGTDCGYNVDTTVVTEPGIDSEIAHLYYVTLGNRGLRDTLGDQRQGTKGTDWGLVNTGAFQNLSLQPRVHWSGTEYVRKASWAWRFGTGIGLQTLNVKSDTWYAMAVRPGDVATVPAGGAKVRDAIGEFGRTWASQAPAPTSKPGPEREVVPD